MRINPLLVIAQVSAAMDVLSNLHAGDSQTLPKIRISDHGRHMDITIQVWVEPSQQVPHTPSLSGQSKDAT